MPQIPVVIIDGPTIAAGESLSDAVDVSAGKVARITLPGPEEWVKANLTFQLSTDGNYFNDIFNDHGEEIMIPAVPYWASIVLGARANLDTVVWLKIRSGTRDHPVIQPHECKMALTLQSYE